MKLSDIKPCPKCGGDDVGISLIADVREKGECLVIVECLVCSYGGWSRRDDKDKALAEVVREWNGGR